MRSYSRKYLPDMEWVTNFDAVVERIDLAATKAALVMRQLGMTLPGNQHPTLDAIDEHLRFMVSQAVGNLPTFFATPGADDAQGEYSDELFEVYVGLTGGSGQLDVDILMRLT